MVGDVQIILKYTASFILSRTSLWGVLETPWAQGGPRTDIQDLWRHWWKGPSHLSVGKGRGHWERLPPKETRNHNGSAMNND